MAGTPPRGQPTDIPPQHWRAQSLQGLFQALRLQEALQPAHVAAICGNRARAAASLKLKIREKQTHSLFDTQAPSHSCTVVVWLDTRSQQGSIETGVSPDYASSQ